MKQLLVAFPRLTCTSCLPLARLGKPACPAAEALQRECSLTVSFGNRQQVSKRHINVLHQRGNCQGRQLQINARRAAADSGRGRPGAACASCNLACSYRGFAPSVQGCSQLQPTRMIGLCWSRQDFCLEDKSHTQTAGVALFPRSSLQGGG